MRTIAIINQKGGSGKTTTAINLGAVLAKRGEKTLVVDVDPQAHCALGLAVPEGHIEGNIGDAMVAPIGRPLDPNKFVWRLNRTLHLAPSTMRLAGLEAARGGLVEREDRDTRLAAVLAGLSPEYEWCLIDCPPFIGLLTFNALRAADDVLIPVETGYFAMQGAAKQVATIQALCRRFGAETPYWILATMHEDESSLAEDVLAELRKKFKHRVIPVVIHRDPKLRECVSMGMPVVDFDPISQGAADYAALATWLGESLDHHSKPGGRMERPLQPQIQVRPTAPSRAGAAIPIPVAQSRAAELAERARRLSARHHERADQSAPVESESAAAQVINGEDQNVGLKLLDPKPPAATVSPAMPDRMFGVQSTSQGLLFVQPGGPQLRIHIAGEHNQWSAEQTLMRYNPERRVHEAILKLEPGEYRYRLVVNGRWTSDPYNPNTVPNPFGDVDSIARVEERNHNKES